MTGPKPVSSPTALNRPNELIRLVRAMNFSAAHRDFDPSLTVAENLEFYGPKLATDGFGHNYRLEIHFEGPVDPLTGMIVNLSLVDEWIRVLSETLDHQNLNHTLDFGGRAPTLERIANYALERLEELVRTSAVTRDSSDSKLPPEAPSLRISHVRLYEDDTLWIDRFA